MDVQNPDLELREPALAYLELMNGPQPGRQYPIESDEIALGRASSCNLGFPGDDSISRLHARIINKLGLFWLEDLGSTNGTFITTPDGLERRLAPHEPVLLLNGSHFRVGVQLTFMIKGVAASQDEATRLLRRHLHQMLLDLYNNLSQLPPAQQQEQLLAIRDLQNRIGAARDEEELALLAVRGIQNLRESLVQTIRFPLPEEEEAQGQFFALPPLPDDLPDPGDPKRLRTLQNAFITDIRICFPNDPQQYEQN